RLVDGCRGRFDAGGNAALGIVDAGDGVVDATAQAFVDLGHLGGDEVGNLSGTVVHSIGDVLEARIDGIAGAGAVHIDGVGQFTGAFADRGGHVVGRGFQHRVQRFTLLAYRRG